MELRQLTTFVAVVRHGTLSAAAAALDYSQASVTLHVQQLEQAVGAPLFDRIGRSVALTPVGRRVHERALQILQAVGDLERDAAAMHAGDAGAVRIGSIEPTASCRLPAAVQRLRAARPGIDLRVEVGGTATMIARVRAGEVDFAITTTPPPDAGVLFERWFDERLVAVVPRRDGRARHRRLTAAHLAAGGVVLTEHGCAYRQAIEAAFARRGARIAVRRQMGSVPAVIASVRNGLGVGIVPVTSVSTVDADYVVRPIADVPLRVAVGLTTRPSLAEPSRLVQVVRDHFRAHLAGRKRRP